MTPSAIKAINLIMILLAGSRIANLWEKKEAKKWIDVFTLVAISRYLFVMYRQWAYLG